MFKVDELFSTEPSHRGNIEISKIESRIIKISEPGRVALGAWTGSESVCPDQTRISNV